MLTLLTATALAGSFALNDPDRGYAIELTAEAGFLAPLSHTLQFGSDGSVIDYVGEGGQDNLFPFVRPTATLRWKRQSFTLLWQPLDLNTTAVVDRDLTIDGLVFPAGTPIEMRYGFSFFRLSWGHRLIAQEDFELSVGLGLQIRNATIGFTTVDGTLSETNRDIGPVPLLEFEIRKRFDSGFFMEAEVDGFYAPIAYLNGRDNDVIGAIADIQLRAGLALMPPVDAFLGVRYIGGGAQGTGTSDGVGDGYTANWLHFLTVSLGARIR